jgi:Fe-S cluster biogenesis protein NfuA/nitrite reductase/ring-hydroxylating ferredoxin subunit
VNQQGKRIHALVERIDSLPDAAARELVHECLQSILALHGDGLARILQLVKNAGGAGQEIKDALLRDKLVRGLLLIHGLHPVPLETRLREALEKIRPYMKSHGGNVELIHLENDLAKLRLEGTCKSCPSSSVTMELAVRQAVEEACPDLLGFEVEGVVAQSAATNHTPAEAPKWTVMDNFVQLQDGEMRVMEVAAVPVLFVKAIGHLYAYRNHCPACATRLDAAVLESKILNCRLGHRFDVQRAGLCPDNPEIHLEPFPLLAANGTVRISVR